MAVFQHKYEKALPLANITEFVINALNECRGQPVACVLLNAAEVAIFNHELTSKNTIPQARLSALGADGAASFWDDREGRLWLMTYDQLSDILTVPGARPRGDLTLILHLGCGEYTWDIVKGCHDLWEWARGFQEQGQEHIIWVYTISSLERSIYRDAPATHLGLTNATPNPPRVELRPRDEFVAAVAKLQEEDAAHAELCRSALESQGPKAPLPMQANHAVLFAPEGKLLEACHDLDRPAPSHVQLKGDMTGQELDEWVEVLLHRAPVPDCKVLVVRPDVGMIGTVRNLGPVLVLPVRCGFYFDRRISQVVLREDVPMSKAEVRYACRVACVLGKRGNDHVVSIFATRDEFDKLPAAPTDPMAFTADLPAILLFFCRHSYFDGYKTPPIRMPSDTWMVNEYLRRLDVRGLTQWRGGPLTELGMRTSWWHYTGGVVNFDVANLLAMASTVQDAARASAIVQVAAVLLHPDSARASPISALLSFQGRNPSAAIERLSTKDMAGFAELYVARGPIWVAIAIWARQKEVMSKFDTSMGGHLSRCDNMLLVCQETLNMVQKNWETIGKLWTGGQGRAQICDDPSISGDDFLFLEECIVRVWMHQLVLVGLEGSGLGAFARDLTSGCHIERPAGDPVNWRRITLREEAEPFEGQPYIGAFAVYTALHRNTMPDGTVEYVPDSLTYVSTRAVRHVLRDVAASRTQVGRAPPIPYDLLRTEYPLCSKAGEKRS